MTLTRILIQLFFLGIVNVAARRSNVDKGELYERYPQLLTNPNKC